MLEIQKFVCSDTV